MGRGNAVGSLKRRWSYRVATIVAVGALLGVAACGGDDDDSGTPGASGKAKKIDIALLLSGGVDATDYGKIMHNAMKKAIGDVDPERFELRPVPNVPYTPRATQIVNQLFAQGTEVIVDTGGYGTLLANACKRSPDRMCINYGTQLDEKGLSSAPNLSTVYVDQGPMFYAEGVAAGLTTKSDTIGFISAFKVPFNTVVVNAMALGCQSVNPDCKVRNVYLNSYYDPPKTVEAAKSLVNAGADVIASFISDVTPVKAGADAGAKVFGFYSDQRSAAPDAWITGILFEDAMTKVFTTELEALADGSWKPGRVEYGPDPAPNLDLAPWGESIPEEVRSRTEEAIQKMRDGSNPFTGPIKDKNGEVRVPEGEEIDMRGEYMYTKWIWPVEGVTGL
jgi:basic membrane protein A and related proteins